MSDSAGTAKVAKHGEKMIEVRVRFWTDALAKEKKTLLPKHAWDCGTVDMPTNKSHGIASGSTLPFNSILDLQAVIGRVLLEHGVELHAGSKLRKLIRPTPGKSG